MRSPHRRRAGAPVRTLKSSLSLLLVLLALLVPTTGGAQPAAPDTVAVPDTVAAPDTLSAPTPTLLSPESALELPSPVVTPEDAPPAPPEEPADPPAKTTAQVELGLTGQSGNTNKIDTTLRGRVSRVSRHTTVTFAASLAYGEARQQKNAQESTGALNYDHYRWSRWSVFGFATLLNNPFQDLRFRLSVAAGARYTILKGTKGSLSLSLAGVREDEEFLDGSGRHRNRFSWRDKAEWRIGEKSVVTNTTFLVQSFDAPFDDYRIESVTDVTIPAGSVLAFRHGFRYTYDTTPRPGIQTTDRKFTSSLVLTLK